MLSFSRPTGAKRGMLLRAMSVRLYLTIALGAAVSLGAAASPVDQGLDQFRQGRFAEAFEAWQASAQAGDARAALFLGVLYDSGLGVVQNEAEALAWYRRSAEGGNAEAAFNIGVLYDSGIGVPRDLGQAAEWYTRAAAQGSGRAAYNLGLLYEAGTGVKHSQARAAEYFRQAERRGIAAARSHLPDVGLASASLPRPPVDLAMDDFRKAQQLLLARGPAEAGKVAALFRQAADQHNALAEYDLGYCYDKGIGVPQDHAQAVVWYRRAAADASDNNLHNLALSGASNLGGEIRQTQAPATAASP